MDTLIFLSSCPLVVFAAMTLFMAPKNREFPVKAAFLLAVLKVAALAFILSVLVGAPLSYWLSVPFTALLIVTRSEPLAVDRLLKVFSSVVSVCSILKLIGGQS